MKMTGIFVLFLFLQEAIFAADAFQLKNNQIFKGTIISEDDNFVLLDINGSKVRILKSIITLKNGIPFYQTAESKPVVDSQPRAIASPTDSFTDSSDNNAAPVQAEPAPVATPSTATISAGNGPGEPPLTGQQSEPESPAKPPDVYHDSVQGTVTEAIQSEKEIQLSDIGGAKKGENYISILQIAAAQVPENIRLTLSDDLRRAFAATGRFQVLEREKMKNILEEQAFRNSDECQDSSCFMKIGRLFGVAKLIVPTISITGKKRYSVALRVIDVQTGVTNAINQTGDGDLEDQCKIMFEDLASDLAGKPTQSRSAYLYRLAQQKNESLRSYESETKRFYIAVAPRSLYPLHILQSNTEPQRQARFESDPTILFRPSMKDNFDFGADLRAGYRLSRRIFLEAKLGYMHTRWSNNPTIMDFTMNEIDTIGSTQYHYRGPVHASSNFYEAWSAASAGVGLNITAMHFARYELGFSIIPEYSYITFYRKGITTIDQTYVVYQGNYLNYGAYYGLFRDYQTDIKDAALHGHAFGGECSLNNSYHLSPSFGISFSTGAHISMALRMSGREKLQRNIATRNSSQDAATKVSSQTDEYDVDLVYWDYWGADDKTWSIEKSGSKVVKDGVVIHQTVKGKEWSDFYARLSIEFYF